MERVNEISEFDKIIKGQLCPYCNCETELVSDKEIYGPSATYNKNFYRCIQNHDHYVGTYDDNKKSLGRLADKDLRPMKRNAHDALDPLWRDKPSRFKNRYQAYKWLSAQMSLDSKYTHIGMFTAEQCIDAIAHCSKLQLVFKKL